MSTSVALSTEIDEILQGHLLQQRGCEDVAFAIWHPSAGRERMSALLREVILPRDGDRVRGVGVSFTGVFFQRALETAMTAGGGLALLHSHLGPGWQGLSDDDHEAEAGIAGAVQAATRLPFVGLTLGTDGTWSGRFWRRQGPRQYAPEWCESVRSVGRRLRVSFAPRLRPVPEFRPELSRTVSAWGPAVQGDLMRLRVGVVGAGSVGSLVAEALARMGIQSVLLLDFDSVEEVNLDRLLHATREDAARRIAKVDCLARALRRSATADEFVAEGYELSVVERDGFQAALDCDLLFSCVDRPWPRSAMDGIAFAHLVPVVDGGVLVTTRGGGTALRHADWRAHVVAPGRRCMECLGQYLAGDVSLERDGYLDDPTYIQGLPPDHRLRRNENVFAFAMAAASLQVLQALSFFIAPSGVSDVGAQMHHFVTGRLDVDERGCEPHCMHAGLVALGDHAPVSWTGAHALAERKRTERARGVAVAPPPTGEP